MAKQKTCSKSSGKRLTPTQKGAKKLASIKKSSHWAVVCQWDGFIPFSQSSVEDELSWAKSQMLGFQKAHMAFEMNGQSIYEGAPEEAPAYDARRVVLNITTEELEIAECDLGVLNGMIAEERKALSKVSSEEGKTLRQKNLAKLLEEREDLVHRVHSMRMAIRRARTVGGWNWTEWEPVSSVRVNRKRKPKAKAKAKAKPKAKVAAPVVSAKAEMKARKSREVRLQRVEAAARKAAHEAAERQLEAAVRKELNKILAERRAKAEAERKAAAAAEKTRLEAARKAAAAKKAEAERKAAAARERAEERKLYSTVYNATLRTTLSRMVREEVARQLAAA